MDREELEKEFTEWDMCRVIDWWKGSATPKRVFDCFECKIAEAVAAERERLIKFAEYVHDKGWMSKMKICSVIGLGLMDVFSRSNKEG